MVLPRDSFAALFANANEKRRHLRIGFEVSAAFATVRTLNAGGLKSCKKQAFKARKNLKKLINYLCNQHIKVVKNSTFCTRKKCQKKALVHIV